MRRAVRGILAFLILTPAASLVTARAMLPASTCEVTTAQIAAVRLETSYDAVKQVLGCDGVHTLDFEIEGLRSDIYRWRGKAWPYATFTGHFYNGVLHGTDQVWLNLQATWHLPGAETVATAEK